MKDLRADLQEDDANMSRLNNILGFWLSFLFCLVVLGVIAYLMLSTFFWVMGYGFALNLVKHS